MVVTVKGLENAGACEDQVGRVATYWGRSVKVSMATAAEASALGLEPAWAARHLLSAKVAERFNVATKRARMLRNKRIFAAHRKFVRDTTGPLEKFRQTFKDSLGQKFGSARRGMLLEAQRRYDLEIGDSLRVCDAEKEFALSEYGDECWRVFAEVARRCPDIK